MRTDALPKINRRFDRRLYGIVYISNQELKERGIVADFKAHDKLVYNGEVFAITASTTNGFLIQRRKN